MRSGNPPATPRGRRWPTPFLAAIGMRLLIQSTASAQSDHHYRAEDVQNGYTLYQLRCQLCHGPNGDMIGGDNLARQRFHHPRAPGCSISRRERTTPSRYRREDQEYSTGRSFTGGGVNGVAPAPGAPTIGIGRPDRIDYWTDEVGSGATVAWNPVTGARAWRFAQHDVTDGGMLVTASDIVFTGGREGYFYAFDATTGALLWNAALGGPIVMGPITYQVDGKQYVAVIAGMCSPVFRYPIAQEESHAPETNRAVGRGRRRTRVRAGLQF